MVTLRKMKSHIKCNEGIRRQRFVSKASGKIEDEYITGLLRDEWIK